MEVRRSWIVCQIGAREHYAVARALHAQGDLHQLITDAWMPKCRHHPQLHDAVVRSDNLDWITSRLSHQLHRRTGWNRILENNQQFQKMALRHLERVQGEGAEITLFAYSYAAHDLFDYARSRGWTTVLGQIDPGPEEERIVTTLCAQHPEWSKGWEPAPASYWEHWRQETRMAHHIVVNSEWSRQCLLKEGIPEAKLRIIPLAYEPITTGRTRRILKNAKSHPTHQEAGKRKTLRVLFLGQANVRKGIHDLVVTARLLEGEPFHFDIVGPHPPLPPGLPSNVHFHGPTGRNNVGEWYRQADVFVLPTHSDGFALTQLEAMAHGLPVVATLCCGRVVEDGLNGWIIPAGDPPALADVLHSAASDAKELARRAHQARLTSQNFGISSLMNALSSICG